MSRGVISLRVRAAGVIARQQLRETLLSPGLSVTLALGMAIAYLLCTGYVDAIDSSGFDPRLSPFWGFVVRALSSGFGPGFVEKLFTEGPFLAALVLSYAPVLIFLSLGSVFRFGTEKSAGGVEMFVYGPADGTSYILASFAKDGVLAALSLAVLTLYFFCIAEIENLALGPLFFVSLPIALLLALGVLAYGLLSSIVADVPASGLAIFIGICAMFTALLAGASAVGATAAQAVAVPVSAAVRWISPLYYSSLALRAYQGGSLFNYLLGLTLLAALASALLAACHFILRWKGVRA
jgi:hypothetical protein